MGNCPRADFPKTADHGQLAHAGYAGVGAQDAARAGFYIFYLRRGGKLGSAPLPHLLIPPPLAVCHYRSCNLSRKPGLAPKLQRRPKAWAAVKPLGNGQIDSGVHLAHLAVSAVSKLHECPGHPVASLTRKAKFAKI